MERLRVIHYDWNQGLLFRTEDIMWYVRQLRPAGSEREKCLWGALLSDRAYPHPGQREDWEVVLAACLCHPPEPQLASIYERWFAGVELGSKRAAEEQQHWKEHLDRDARGKARLGFV